MKKSKCQIQQNKVDFHGNVFSKDGLKTDLERVRFIVKMPRLTDKAGVQRLLEVGNHVSKFVPNMSDFTASLRQLPHQDVLWHWEEQQETSFQAKKNLLPLLQC